MAEGRNIGEDIYAAIRKDIIFGRLEAGDKMRMNALTKRYGASVSTLREVLNRLDSDGFVKGEGQRGYTVSPMSAKGLREIADLRILLECHALRQSFSDGDTEWEVGVVAAYHKLHRIEERMKNNDVEIREMWKQYDWEFHKSLIEACGSKELMALHGTIFDKYLRYQMRLLTFRGDPAASEHKALFEAAMQRDSSAGENILRQHIEGGVEHCLSFYQSA